MKTFLIKICAVILSFALIASLNIFNNKGINGSESIKIALITDQGDINDKSFNQTSWEGVKAYSDPLNVSYAYYRPTVFDTKGFVTSMNLAIADDTEVIVCPGFTFSDAMARSSSENPKTKYIMIDSVPTGTLLSNTFSILYDEAYSGFMAGYAMVIEGYRNLGFMGGADQDPVAAYGWGYVEGAEYAASELHLSKQSINMNFTYLGSYTANPAYKTKALQWYQSGTDVIFACGGAIYSSIVSAAESIQNKYMVGVDTDQYYVSDRVLTSACKNIKETVKQVLERAFDDTAWSSSKDRKQIFSIDEDGESLAMEHSRMKKFTNDSYQKLLVKLKDKTIKVRGLTEIQDYLKKLNIFTNDVDDYNQLSKAIAGNDTGLQYVNLKRGN